MDGGVGDTIQEDRDYIQEPNPFMVMDRDTGNIGLVTGYLRTQIFGKAANIPIMEVVILGHSFKSIPPAWSQIL